MTRYHLHARLFEGSLDAPTRNELQSNESDDYDASVQLAEALSAGGFAVWLYERQPLPHAASGGYRVIAEWRADGTRVR